MTKDWCIILAAGKSERFNGPKALAEWRGQSLISRAVEMANQAVGENVLIVWGAYEIPEIQNAHSVFNDQWPLGMGASLSCALRWLEEHSHKPDGVLVMAVDQPLITADHLKALVEKGKELSLSVLTSNGQVDGPPAYLLRKDYMALLNLKDDRGAKAHLDTYTKLEIAPHVFADIDTQADMESAKEKPR